MICPKCQAQNGEGSIICLNCGANMTQEENDKPQEKEELSIEFQSISHQSIPENKEKGDLPKLKKPPVKINILAFFITIWHVILYPFSALEKELDRFKDIRLSAILMGIIAFIATIVKLLVTMVSAILVESYDGTHLVWDNLNNLNYFKEIGLNLLLFLLMIIAIAGIYYLAGLVAKKETNFSKFLALASLALVPYLFTSILLNPILSLLYYPLGKSVAIIGQVYTLIIIYESMNNNIKLESDKKIYFNLICMSILLFLYFLVNYFILQASIDSAVNDISNIFNMFE